MIMQIYKTQEQIDADHKYFELMAAAERTSGPSKDEIARRHKKYKQRAKNLAGLKGADKNAILYERLILKQRLDEIEDHLIKVEQVKCSNSDCGIDYGETCCMGEFDIKDCRYFQNSFTA